MIYNISLGHLEFFQVNSQSQEHLEISKQKIEISKEFLIVFQFSQK
jgi:hypothetical protein